MSSERPGSGLPHIHRLFAEGSLTGCSDGQLLDRYLTRRDELAFEALVERHAAMVLSVCRRSLDEPGAVDDAFQATFLVLARRSRLIRDRPALGSWLFGVARRVCLLSNRAAARRRKHERQAGEQRVAQRAVSTEDNSGALVYEEIERLPSAYRLPIVLCLMEGRSRSEAALALCWTEGMVRGRLARARRLLRKRLIQRGVAPAAALAVLAREGTSAGAVPSGLIASTARAAAHPATGSAAAALTEEVIKVMVLKKLMVSAAALVGVVLVACAVTAALMAREEQAAPPVAEAALPPGFARLDDPAKSSLHGRVVGPDGKPVASARVSAKTANGALLAETTTDADGRFRVGPFDARYRNSVELTVAAGGLARVLIPRESIVPFAGLDSNLGQIRLDAGRVFTGQVLDADGKPRPGATIEWNVRWSIAGHTVRDTGPDVTLTTDAEGRFRTPPLPIGLLSLSVRVPDRQLAYVLRPIRPGGEEDLEPIRLDRDTPLTGVVRDEDGKPIVGASIHAGAGRIATTDAEGKFTLRGFGPNPSFQMSVRKEGYAGVVGRVNANEAGVRFGTRNDVKPAAPAMELAVTLKRVGWIEGRAVDADTGEPVHLDRMILSDVERKPNGEAVIRLRIGRDEFEQPEPGKFRIAYSSPGEHNLTLSAAGYHDAETFTPKVTELNTIGGIVVRLKRKVEGSASTIARQTITGTVTRAGRPVKYGWLGIWRMHRQTNPINAPMLHGRMVVGPPVAYGAPIRDGSYAIDVPFQGESWYVVVEEPGHALTPVGPVTIALNEKKTLDIACTEGGTIRGLVKNVPPGWAGHVWVVAFSKSAVRAEARVERDGTFLLPPLPPGEYGLKAGHDAYEDPEVYPGFAMRNHPEVAKETADPWKRAKVVTVESGRQTLGVEVEFPAP